MPPSSGTKAPSTHVRVHESPSGRERARAAQEFVASFDAGIEILVVGASREAADDFTRRLARDRGATFGLHRYSFRQLVAHLAMSELAKSGVAPATPLGIEAVAARAAFDARDRDLLTRLDEVSRLPGFPAALAFTLDELRLSGLAPESLEPLGEDGADLRALAELYEAELDRSGIADRAELCRRATVALEDPAHAALRSAPVLLLDVPVRYPAEREFLAALVGGARAAFATVPPGDRRSARAFGELGDPVDVPAVEAEGSLARLQVHLFSESAPPAGEADEEVRFFSAPGEARECVEIARRVHDEARRGVALDEMAVFVRTPEAYAPHLETAFRRADLPSYFARGTKRPDPAGRAFLALLACKSERLSARRFSEYLSFAQVPDLEDGAPPEEREGWIPARDESLGPAGAPKQLALPFGPPPAASESPPEEDHPAPEGTLRAPWKWEEYLVEAAVIGGRDRWERRLSGLRNELRIKLEEIVKDDPESPRRQSLGRDVTNLEHLERFALPVVAALDALPERATWREWLDRLGDLAPRVLRVPDRVIGLLGEMQPMGDVGPVTIDEVRAVLSERLSTLERDPPGTRFGRVFVGTPEHARGRTFRVVFVPGLAERVFPQRPREDPLLLDAARIELSDRLATQEDRGQEERLLLHLAIGAAEERAVLSYPRVDVVEARPRVPSFYGLDVERATRGALPDYEELEREAEAEASARLAWPSPEDPARAIDPVEHDLSVLGSLLHRDSSDVVGRARYLLELNEHLARSLRRRYVHWEFHQWSPEDGIVRATEKTSPFLLTQGLKNRPYSVTALQRFATCPYQFLLSAIYRLEPREDAVPLVQVDPLTRGRMIHEIQAAVLRRLEEEKKLPVTPRRVEHASRALDETVDEIAERYREDLAPAIVRVWQDEVDAIRADLRVWIRRLAEHGKEWVPAHFELMFGLPPERDYDPHSLADPVVLSGGWKLRGAVDLVERSPDGDVYRVTDHKTGRNYTTEGWIVGGGETLQPVLYSLAVEAALGRPVSEARLFFCTTRGGFTDRVVVMSEWARLYGRQVFEVIDRAVESGNLPPSPRRGACRYCDFRPVCGPDEERRAPRKDRSRLQDLDELRNLP